MSERPAFKAAVIYLDTSILDKITAEIKPNAAKIVEKYGYIIAEDAAKNAPVDTTALRNSIVAESKMKGEMTFIVQDGVNYGIWQEFGTSRMAAQPFLIPAVEAWRDKFYAAFSELFR